MTPEDKGSLFNCLFRSRIRIVSCDSQGAEVRLPGADEKPVPVASIEINDPEDRGYFYCIGFKLIGSDPQNPSSWEYHHADHWNRAKERKNQDKYEPELVAQETIEQVLTKHGSSLEKVLGEYCGKLEKTKTS